MSGRAERRGMRYLSICSGIEAATVAWAPLGWRAVAFSEIEKFPSAVLAHHYPDVPNLGDMTKIKGDDYHGLVDLLVGGTPCQSFSIAGLRGGLDDPRGQLTLTFIGLVESMRPKWVVWENVPGVLSDNEGRTFGAVLGALGQCGYGFAYRVCDAQYFGVPQQRRRVFVVGCLGDWRAAAAVLLERHSLSGDSPPRRGQGKDVAGTISRCSFSGGPGGRPEGESGNHFIADVTGSLTARYGRNGGAANGDLTGNRLIAHGYAADVGPTLTSRANGISQENGLILSFHGAQDPDVSGVVTHPCGRNRGLETCVMQGRWRGDDGRGYDRPPHVTDLPSLDRQKVDVVATVSFRGRAHGATLEMGNDISTALRAPQGGGDKTHVLARSTVRRLTPRECERLQGFPDDYTMIPWRGKSATDCPDGPRYKAIGNSMAVPVMRWIGERIQVVDDILAEASREGRIMDWTGKHIKDLDGCDGCPLREYCSPYDRGPMCEGFEEDELLQDILDKTEAAYCAHDDYEDEQRRKKEAAKERQAVIQAQRRATLTKNRDKNRARAVERKKERAKQKEQVADLVAKILREFIGR